MPPWSDVRALAESLSHSDETITFLDVLPLQRLAQSLMHMPLPTLNAIIQLHGCPRMTLGAQEVVSDLLRSYHTRVAHERKLGQSVLTQAHHGKTVRLVVGQVAIVQLPLRRGQQWHLGWRGLGATLAAPKLDDATGRGDKHQRITVVCDVPGAFELEGKAVAADKSEAFGAAAKHVGAAAKSKMPYRLVIIVEEPQPDS